MAGKLLGYEFLREHLDLSAFPCARPARIGSVTNVLQRPDGLDVPVAAVPPRWRTFCLPSNTKASTGRLMHK